MLIDSFRLSGAETVLDPQTAELAALSRFKGQVRHAPWGAYCTHQPFGPMHFIKGLKPLADAAALREVDLKSLMKRMHDHATKLEKVRNTLEAYHEARAKAAPRVRPVGPARTSKISQGEGRR